MSLIDFIFGSFSAGPKIYRSAVLRIPGHRFNRQVRIKIGDNEQSLVGESLRDYLAGLASNGISFTSMEEKLKKAGLKDKQHERRKEIMTVLRGEAGNKTSKINKENKKNEDGTDNIININL